MSANLDLKQIELKAFRSTFQDGLSDIQYGLIIAAMAIFMYRPATGYAPINIILAVLMITAVNILFLAGKRYITLPRMGQVAFGPVRKQKQKNMMAVLALVTLLLVILVVLTGVGWFNPGLVTSLFGQSQNVNLDRAVVAAISALIVGVSLLVIAYFSDFMRGYYIAIMMALAVFLMIFYNQPVFPLVIGALILLPGVVLLIRFLNKYPRPKGDELHG